MDLSKFTERSRGFVQAAQTIATRESHQRLTPDHILKALMDDDQGLASNLITSAGGDPARVLAHVDQALAKLPQITGDAVQVYLDQSTAKVMAEAEALAKKAGDSFVPVERVLMALGMIKSSAKDALEAGIPRAKIYTHAIPGHLAETSVDSNYIDPDRYWRSAVPPWTAVTEYSCLGIDLYGDQTAWVPRYVARWSNGGWAIPECHFDSAREYAIYRRAGLCLAMPLVWPADTRSSNAWLSDTLTPMNGS